MAVANTKATQISQADATPVVLTNSYIADGLVHEGVGTVEVAAADDAASVYRMVRVPSNARITSILMGNDALGAGFNQANIGAYQTAQNGGAVVSKDVFASDVDLTAAIAFTEYINEAAATDISKVEQQLWQVLGLTVDSMREYDICVTSDGDPAAAGTLSLKVKYVI